jgi:hypothetical protein
MERQDLSRPPFIAPHIDAMLDMLLTAHYAEASMAASLQTLHRHLANPATRLAFTGQILYVSSASEPGRIHQTDGTICQCRGKNHVRCWHRLLHHKLLLYTALVDPTWLISTPQEEFDVRA